MLPEIELTHINLNDNTVSASVTEPCPSLCAIPPEAAPVRTIQTIFSSICRSYEHSQKLFGCSCIKCLLYGHFLYNYICCIVQPNIVTGIGFFNDIFLHCSSLLRSCLIVILHLSSNLRSTQRPFFRFLFFSQLPLKHPTASRGTGCQRRAHTLLREFVLKWKHQQRCAVRDCQAQAGIYHQQNARRQGGHCCLTDDGRFAGFCYIETWSGKEFIANSGLIVVPEFRKDGLAKRIKQRIFELSREKYPDAKNFGITTSHAVMKINTELGYVPALSPN